LRDGFNYVENGQALCAWLRILWLRR
jgi:hypothetical protein